MFRRIATITALSAAVGGPYLATETEVGRNAVSSVTGALEDSSVLTSSTTSTASYASHSHHELEDLRRQSSDRFRYETSMAQTLGAVPENPEQAPTLAVMNVNDLREVMRFDITPDWVIQRFERVSTVLADMRLEGMRVPVVTGTRADDLAGTLTFYFDHNDKLQRVTMHAFTGDPNRLVGAMTQHYGLQREPSLEAGVYTKRWNGNPVHFLRLTHAPVIHSNAVHQKYTVFLELNQPNLAYGISTEARRIVQADRMSGRW